MKPRAVNVLLGITILFTACGPQATDKPDEKAIIERGQKAATALKTGLLGQLQPAMKAGGPLAALPMCKSTAPALTSAASDGMQGISIFRTSSRIRNPDNAPDPLDLKVLEIFQTAKDNNMAIPEEHLEWTQDPMDSKKTVARYYQPLMVQPICLNCHGSKAQMKPEVIELIKTLYPEDLATGYQNGDFRGLIRVDITLLK